MKILNKQREISTLKQPRKAKFNQLFLADFISVRTAARLTFHMLDLTIKSQKSEPRILRLFLELVCKKIKGEKWVKSLCHLD